MSESAGRIGAGLARGFAAAVDYGVLVASTAVSLLAAASHRLGGRADGSTLVMVFLGSWGVYLLDRRWDLAKDRDAHPSRVARIRSRVKLVDFGAAVAILGAVGLGLQQAPSVRLLLAGVFLLSVSHHGLKRIPWLKPLYIALSWWAVTVGIPLLTHWEHLQSEGGQARAWSVLPLGLAIGANVLAGDAADRDAEARTLSPVRLWWIARAVAAAGVVASLWMGGRAAAWAPVPVCVLLSLLPRRPDPTWTATAVDGALLLGGAIVLAIG